MRVSVLDYWCAMLSRAGYGSVDLLKSYDCVTFLNILDYEVFCREMEAEAHAMARMKK